MHDRESNLLDDDVLAVVGDEAVLISDSGLTSALELARLAKSCRMLAWRASKDVAPPAPPDAIAAPALKSSTDLERRLALRINAFARARASRPAMNCITELVCFIEGFGCCCGTSFGLTNCCCSATPAEEEVWVWMSRRAALFETDKAAEWAELSRSSCSTSSMVSVVVQSSYR